MVGIERLVTVKMLGIETVSSLGKQGAWLLGDPVAMCKWRIETVKSLAMQGCLATGIPSCKVQVENRDCEQSCKTRLLGYWACLTQLLHGCDYEKRTVQSTQT